MIKLVAAYIVINTIGFLSYFHIFCSKIAYLQGILYYPSPKAEETLGNLGFRLQSLTPFTEGNQTSELQKLVLGMLGCLSWCHSLYLTDLSLPSFTQTQMAAVSEVSVLCLKCLCLHEHQSAMYCS